MSINITCNKNIMHGEPVIEGTRIPAYVILDYLSEGYDFERIKAAYPHLTDEHIMAVIKYAARSLRNKAASF